MTKIKKAVQKAIETGLADRVFDLTDHQIYYIEGTNFDPANTAPLVDLEKSGIPALADSCLKTQ